MRSLLTMVPILVLLFGCSRPEVAVKQQAGKMGEFCVSAADCGGGMSCEAHACCQDSGCRTRCDSLMEKEGTAAYAARLRHPAHEAFIKRKCVALCCSGQTAGELEEGLEIWARELPGHAGI